MMRRICERISGWSDSVAILSLSLLSDGTPISAKYLGVSAPYNSLAYLESRRTTGAFSRFYNRFFTGRTDPSWL